MSGAILDASIDLVASLVAKGEVSAEEVTRAALDRIRRDDPKVNAFVSVQDENAIAAARAVDAKRARGEAIGALAGVPIGIKDALCTVDAPTTSASKILLRAAKSGEMEIDAARGYRPPYDATVVAKLRAADAILIGKANLDELSMGSSTENSAFFATKNPWDLARTAGGTSGGSAALVAARFAPGSLGSDTGGSIRQPAAFTGTVGIKPTYGRVSRYGLIAFASSLDQVGPFASDVRGAARILDVIAGKDPKDATSLDAPAGGCEEACGRDVSALTIGVPPEYFAKGLDPAVETSVRDAIAGLERLGCKVREVALPHTRYAVAAYYVIATAEASSNLARFDGVRYGLRVAEPKGDLNTLYAKTRGQGFGREVKRRIMLGTYVLSAGYYDAYYLRAQRVRTLLRRDFEAAFKEVDVIAAPVTPTTAFKLGEKIDDPLAMYLSDIYTLPASLAGLPALSVPCAPVNSLPVGLQLIGRPLEEPGLCALAHAWEQISPARDLRAPALA